MSAERRTRQPFGAWDCNRLTDADAGWISRMLAHGGWHRVALVRSTGAGESKEGAHMEHLLKMVVAVQTGFLNMRDRMRDDRGVTAVEYGLMVAAIAVAIIVVVFALGGHLSDLFGKVDKSIASKT